MRGQGSETKRFSDYFQIDPTLLDAYGAFDVTVERDDPLMIDPKLLDDSAVLEMTQAYDDVHEFFGGILHLLQRSGTTEDALWRNAFRLFDFPEFKAAGLGYARSSTSGRGWSVDDRNRTLQTAREIIHAGISDPTLFELAGLLESGIGADHISDMFGTV